MLGIMHHDGGGAPAFVFDMMEPERPKVDRAVLAFLRTEALHPADFTIRDDGVVRLNPELARRVADVAGSLKCERGDVCQTVKASS
jgi:CRISPR/Cas system-associated endonuclease Cas1